METATTTQGAARRGSSELEEELSLRITMRRVLVAWMFGAAWMSICTGAALTRFGKMLGLREFGFGVLGALPFISAFAQLPASYFLERFGHRKALFLIGNLLHRSLWLAIAAIPWLFPSSAWPAALIALMGLSGLASQCGSLSFHSWFVELVPSRIRGRYMSRRTQAGQIVNLIFTLAVGFLLDWAERISGVALGRTLSALLAASAVFGIVDILFFVRIPDRPIQSRDHAYGWRQMFLQPLTNRSFRFYLTFAALLTFSGAFAGQFVWLYVFDVVKATNMQANLLLVAFPLTATLISLPFWGRMIDRLGRKPVVILAGICILPGAMGWIFVQEGHWFPGYLIILVAAFAWPGVDLGSLNILLGLMERRQGRARNTAYVAITSMVMAATGTVSGLLSGALARRLSDWHGTLWGLALTYHGVLFLIATAPRIAALFFLRGIEEPRAFSARAAFRYMAGTMYSNLQSAIEIPMRLAGRWTYKLSSLRRRGGGKGARGL